MKTKLILFFILVTLISGCADINKSKKNDLAEMNLFGKVKSVKETSYEAVEKFGEIERGEKTVGVDSYYYLFDEFGNLLKKNSYDYVGNLKYGFEYEYEYDEKQNLTFMGVASGRDQAKNIIKYRYDDNGNRIEEIGYDPNGNVFMKMTYKYDDNGNLTEEKSYDSDSGIDSKSIYKYDASGNKIEDNDFDSEGRISKCTYKYDDKGNKLEVINYFLDGSISGKATYKYDEKSNVIEEYDFNVQFTREDDKYNTEQMTTCQYEFDSKNNWIKKIVNITWKSDLFEDDDSSNTSNIIEREIEYY